MAAEEAEKQADYLPYQVEPVKPEPHIIETDVQLSRDIMRVDSRTCIEYVPIEIEKIKEIEVEGKDGKKEKKQIKESVLKFVPVELPYPEVLNDDIAKSYLKEEELAWARMQLDHIYNCIRFAQDYGLYLPYIFKQIAQLQAFLTVTRSRNMAASKLSKTVIHWEEARTSQWLMEKALEEREKKKSLYERLFGKKPSEDKFFETRTRGIEL